MLLDRYFGVIISRDTKSVMIKNSMYLIENFYFHTNEFIAYVRTLFYLCRDILLRLVIKY